MPARVRAAKRPSTTRVWLFHRPVDRRDRQL